MQFNWQNSKFNKRFPNWLKHLFHLWDTKIANRFCPFLNLGYDYTLDQSQTTANDALQYMRYNSTILQEGNGFKPATTGDIGKITLSLKKVGSPTGNVWVEIRANNGGVPGNLIVQSGNLDVSTISAVSAANYDFTFAQGYSLTAETLYWFIYNGDYTISTTDNTFIYGGGGNPYTRGQMTYWNASNWVTSGYENIDCYFLEYWQTPATSIKTINGLAKASVKTINGLAIASVKTWNGLS